VDRGNQGRFVLGPFRALRGRNGERTMGVDAAVKPVEAVVVELMPNAVVRLKLENQDLVLAHAASATKTNFVRVRPGDRVEVELSPHDPGRGRIVRLLK
jgi:translation initiation factor IF-1